MPDAPNTSAVDGIMMGFYSEVIFPFFLNRAMRSETLAPWRKALLADATGEILEIGFGTGANLVHYPSHVQEIHTVEPNKGMSKHWENQRIRIRTTISDAETLPFPNEKFDTVVSTFTLCSVKDPKKVLDEIHRVLKPSGKFLFLEHGLADSPRVAWWQNHLNGLNNVLTVGCNMNREFDKIMRDSKLAPQKLKKTFAKGYPVTHGFFYTGSATKN